MKKSFEVIRTVAVWTVLAVAVFMMIFTMVSVTMFDSTSRSIFGLRIFTVASDSMKATDFDTGDIIFVNGNADLSELREGDIITYISMSPESYLKTVTHKIRTVNETDTGYRSFVTYGTTTGDDDSVPVGEEYVLGRYMFTLPNVGTFLTFLKSTPGYILCVFLPFAILILYHGIKCMLLWGRYRTEQQQSIQSEREAIEKERKETEEMKEELLRLKEQLEKAKEEDRSTD